MTSVAIVLSLLVPVFIGFSVVRICIPGGRDLCRHDWLRLSLGVGTGFGICSCTLFVWLLTFGRVHVLYIGIEAGLVVLLGALAAWSAKRCCLCVSTAVPNTALAGWKHPLLAVFAVAGLAACLSFALESRIHPDGQGDAWAIWNLKARFLFSGGAQWRTVFSKALFWSHPDYPLLLPGAVARGWIYTGTETQAVPIGIAMLFTFGTVGVLTTGLTALGESEKGLIAGTVLAGTGSFVKLGAAQYADVPIAFFFLASILLLCMRDRIPMSGMLLAGVSAALAAWSKNEGLLFLLLLAIALKWARQPLAGVSAGAFCILVLPAIFKLTLAPPNYLAASGMSAVLRNGTDPSRYLLIAVGFVWQLMTFGGHGINPLIPIFATLFLLKTREKPGARTAAIVLAGMCVGDSLAYLITPFDLGWQISRSLDRLLLQLWPTALLAYFCIVEFPIVPASTLSPAVPLSVSS